MRTDHEFQGERSPSALGGDHQLPRLGSLGFSRFADQRQQRLLAGGAEAFCGGAAPALAFSQIAQEGVDRRQRLGVEVHLDPSAAWAGDLHDECHGNGSQAASGHAVAEQFAQRLPQQVGKDELVLKAGADPEGQPGDRRLAVVELVLGDDLHPLHEQQAQEQGDVRRNHRSRNGEQNGRELGHEGQCDQDDADAHADVAGGYAGELRQWDT